MFSTLEAAIGMIVAAVLIIAVIAAVPLAFRFLRGRALTAFIFGFAALLWLTRAEILALALVGTFMLVKLRRHRRRTALEEGRALPKGVQRKAARSAQPSGPLSFAPEHPSPPPFSEAEIYAVSRLLPANWPAVAHGCGLSQRDHRMEDHGSTPGLANGIATLVSGLGALRDSAVIMEADRAFLTPRLLSQPMPSPTGPRVRVLLLPGQTPASVATRAEALAAALHVPAVHVLTSAEDLRDGAVTLSLRTREALTSAPSGRPAPALDLASVPYGIGEDGCSRTLALANLSGWAIGGVPGSGKTASITFATSALMQNPAVQFAVLDAKGGSDWSWAEPRCAAFSNEDEDFEALAKIVEEVHAVMRHRLATQKSERGSANFWSLPLDANHPVIVLLVDECQTIFETVGMSKEEKAKAEALRRRISALIKKGRAAGIVTILMTQKPTADALPTAIRDNCSLRTSFRVVTREAAAAVLGEIPAGTEILPTDISASLPGVAVVASDQGGFERVRFGYISEADAEILAAETASLRRPLSDFLPPEDPNEGETDADR